MLRSSILGNPDYAGTTSNNCPKVYLKTVVLKKGEVYDCSASILRSSTLGNPDYAGTSNKCPEVLSQNCSASNVVWYKKKRMKE